VAARGRRTETEAAPVRYVAELLGLDTDSERAIRWLIALMVFCCDPLAIALTAATAAVALNQRRGSLFSAISSPRVEDK
jgi:ABC-type transport system involved in cytochrome c biogenesis permease component